MVHLEAAALVHEMLCRIDPRRRFLVVGHRPKSHPGLDFFDPDHSQPGYPSLNRAFHSCRRLLGFDNGYPTIGIETI